MNEYLMNESDGSELTFKSARDQVEEDNERRYSRVQLKIQEENMPFDTHHHSSKKRRLKGILRPKTWPNPFVQGRYEMIERMS